MRSLFAKIIFFIMGWKVIGSLEYPKRCIIIGAPHTSNWDFLIGRCYSYIIGISPKYLIKKEWFVPLLAVFFRINGGIPVSRQEKNDLVEKISDLYQRENFMIALSPEGTRSRVNKWKTGFYYIAMTAKVPIVLVKIDYRLKEVGVISEMVASGNIEEDMIQIEKKFKNVIGKIPQNYNPKIF